MRSSFILRQRRRGSVEFGQAVVEAERRLRVEEAIGKQPDMQHASKMGQHRAQPLVKLGVRFLFVELLAVRTVVVGGGGGRRR